jgi:Ca2+-binding EF-hand superfamily protein
MLPKNYLKILNEIDENNDGEISKDEIEKALKKLKNSK